MDAPLDTRVLRVVAFLVASLTFASAHAELSPEDLAKIAQNPVGNLVSVPIQENANFNVGPLDGTQNVVNIQPVIPISVNDDWNVTTHPFERTADRKGRVGWRRGDCNRGWPWFAGSWRCGSRLVRTGVCGSSRRLSA